ncbi:Berberine bridge enzyme-like 23 [Linum grandiflorum]
MNDLRHRLHLPLLYINTITVSGGNRASRGLNAPKKMKQMLLLLLLTIISISPCSTSTPVGDNFLDCISTKQNSSSSSGWIYNPESPHFSPLLDSKVQNTRYLKSTSKPHLILTPSHHSQIQAAILCAKQQDLDVRVRSGGHDYAGLSYLSIGEKPYIVIDLLHFNGVHVDVEGEIAWVESGAQLGELYYAIVRRSSELGFPAGVCPTVGVGGHFGGGGFGTLIRKHGMAADNVVDAYLVDAEGRMMNREGMGEDVFWAIRGGGASSFGVVLSWKVKLVRVPHRLTFFNVHKTLEEGASKLIHKWQRFAHDADEDLFVRTVILGLRATKTVQASFQSLFLGPIDRLIPLMNNTFPELGLRAENCKEGSWVDSVIYFAGYNSGSPPEVLLDKTQMYKANFKAKSDFVTDPIPESGLDGMLKLAVEEDLSVIILEPLGGRMNEIPESYSPFPHRIGNLYNIQYLVKWEYKDNNEEEEKRHIEWMKKLYDYMEPYVSKSPRAAYLNYRDLDLGTNNLEASTTSFLEASVWGRKYFRDNFDKLSKAKSIVDPHNFFNHEQSIPLFI